VFGQNVKTQQPQQQQQNKISNIKTVADTHIASFKEWKRNQVKEYFKTIFIVYL